MLSFQLVLVFFSLSLSFFFPMEKFKIFAWSGLSYFVTFGFMSCFERSFTFQDIGETLIQILFSFYFNGVKYTHLGICKYVCLYVYSCGFFFFNKTTYITKAEDLKKNFCTISSLFWSKEESGCDPSLFFKKTDSWFHAGYWIICLSPGMRTLLRWS